MVKIMERSSQNYKLNEQKSFIKKHELLFKKKENKDICTRN